LFAIFIEKKPIMIYLLPYVWGDGQTTKNNGASGDDKSYSQNSFVSGVFGSVRGLCDGGDRTYRAVLVSTGWQEYARWGQTQG
jgi:hypothetical protein